MIENIFAETTLKKQVLLPMSTCAFTEFFNKLQSIRTKVVKLTLVI